MSKANFDISCPGAAETCPCSFVSAPGIKKAPQGGRSILSGVGFSIQVVLEIHPPGGNNRKGFGVIQKESNGFPGGGYEFTSVFGCVAVIHRLLCLDKITQSHAAPVFPLDLWQINSLKQYCSLR